MTLFIQFSNPITATGVCRIISCILHNHHLDDAGFDLKPSFCAHHDAWLSEGLPELSDGMLDRDWIDVVPFLRREKVRDCQQAHTQQFPHHTPCSRCVQQLISVRSPHTCLQIHSIAFLLLRSAAAFAVVSRQNTHAPYALFNPFPHFENSRLQLKLRCRGSQRLQMLVSSLLLSRVAFCLTCVRGTHCCSSLEVKNAALVMKRFLSDIARRFWRA